MPLSNSPISDCKRMPQSLMLCPSTDFFKMAKMKLVSISFVGLATTVSHVAAICPGFKYIFNLLSPWFQKLNHLAHVFFSSYGIADLGFDSGTGKEGCVCCLHSLWHALTWNSLCRCCPWWLLQPSCRSYNFQCLWWGPLLMLTTTHQNHATTLRWSKVGNNLAFLVSWSWLLVCTCSYACRSDPNAGACNGAPIQVCVSKITSKEISNKSLTIWFSAAMMETRDIT